MIEFYLFSVLACIVVFPIVQYFEYKKGYDLKVTDLLLITLFAVIPIFNMVMCLIGSLSVIFHLGSKIRFFDVVLLKGKKQ